MISSKIGGRINNAAIVCNLGGALIFAAHFSIGKLTKCSLGINYIEKELVIKKKQKQEENALEEKPAQSEEIQDNDEEQK